MSKDSGESIAVEVIYAKPDKAERVPLTLAAGSSVQHAIEFSGLLQKCPEIDLDKNKVGIYAKLVKLDQSLRDHDRVEIYRPLIADPKEVRRQRAAEGKAMKKGAGASPASQQSVDGET